MKNKTLKKIALNAFVVTQVFFLVFGSALPALADKTYWVSRKYNVDDGNVPAGIADREEYEMVESYKKADQSAKVSIAFTPAAPKVGEKVTATATATNFANDQENLYFTWFLKRKGCEVEDDDGDKTTYGVPSEKYDPTKKDYPKHDDLPTTPLEEGVLVSPAECDSDLDGIITVNDWKVDAMRLVAQNGFKPDLGGRYSDLDKFYEDNTDSDDYQAWQGGGDMERMPSHCYGYDATTGFMYEYLDQYLKGAPMCTKVENGKKKTYPAVCGMTTEWEPDTSATGQGSGIEDPCVCDDIDRDGDDLREISKCMNCADGGYEEGGYQFGVGGVGALNPRATGDVEPDYDLIALPGRAGLEAPSIKKDGKIQWWECLIDTNYCHIEEGSEPLYALYNNDCEFTNPGETCANLIAGHMDCHKRTAIEICEKQTVAPTCKPIQNQAEGMEDDVYDEYYKGKYAAVCGNDNDGDGIGDKGQNDYPGIPICPSGGYGDYNDINDQPWMFSIGDKEGPFNYTEPEFDALNIGGSEAPNFDDQIYIDSGRGGYADPQYQDADGNAIDYTKMPVCNCGKATEQMIQAGNVNIPAPFIGMKDPEEPSKPKYPVCEERAPEIEDVLCGSLTMYKTKGSGNANLELESDKQFHIFPKRLPINETTGKVSKNYFDFSRDYSLFSGVSKTANKFEYRKGEVTINGKKVPVSNIGNGSFDKDDERFWGTDPRNPSTAGNGRYDEANLAGLGAQSFTWIYQEGDEVGVGVEGTSNLGTKFPDSSRMIMWAFSKGYGQTTNNDNEKLAACQPKFSGYYEFKDFTNMQFVPSEFKFVPNTINMLTGFMDFDQCLEKSTVPVLPSEGQNGAQPKNMEVELLASPDKPLNDENVGSQQGDTVSVTAVVNGASSTENELNYSWKIQRYKPKIDNGMSVAPIQSDWEKAEATGADDPDNPRPEAICGLGVTDQTECTLKSGDGGKIKLNGTGLTGIDFKLDIKNITDRTDEFYNSLYEKLFNKNGEGYLRISVEARENDETSNPPNSRMGFGQVVLKVSTNANKITVFRPTISGTKLEVPSPLGPLCINPIERGLCPVTKNEIIGLSIDSAAKVEGGSEQLTEFSWFLNDTLINECDRLMSDKCSDLKGTNTTFFPITGKAGDIFTVKVNANSIAGKGAGNSDNTGNIGKKVELFQKFVIVEPTISIVPAGDPADLKAYSCSPASAVCRKKLGSFADPTKEDSDPTKLTSDWSESIFETSPGVDAKLELKYSPSYLNGLVKNVTWQVDGLPVPAPEFTSGATGTVHNASVSGTYSQSPDVYRMLKLKFLIDPSEMKTETLSHSVQVEVNYAAPATAFKNPVRFMANLLSKVPSQILFLFRLILSVGLVIVITGTIFAFFPETNYDRRRS